MIGEFMGLKGGGDQRGMHGRTDESNILATCAPRFDGYAYAEAAGFDLAEVTNRLIDDGIWPETGELRLAAFFGLPHSCSWPSRSLGG